MAGMNQGRSLIALRELSGLCRDEQLRRAAEASGEFFEMSLDDPIKAATFQRLTTRTLDALEQKWGWGAEDLEEAREALC